MSSKKFLLPLAIILAIILGILFSLFNWYKNRQFYQPAVEIKNETPILKTEEENFRIAYYSDNALWIAKGDGVSPVKIFDCRPGTNPGKCQGIHWLKDGRLVIQRTIDKLVNIGQDYYYDKELLIFDLEKNKYDVVRHLENYVTAYCDAFYDEDPLIISLETEAKIPTSFSKKYYWLNPDTNEISQINYESKTLPNGQSFFYQPEDTLTYMTYRKTEKVPNQNGDLLIVDHQGLQKTILYNIKTDFSDLLFEGVDKDIEFKGLNFKVYGQGDCKLSENSTFIACRVLLSPFSKGISTLVLIETKTKEKFLLTPNEYPELFKSGGNIWSFQFSPDTQYLYIGFDRNCTNVDVYRLKMSNKSLTKVLENIQTHGNCAWVFALSPKIEK